MRLRPVLIAAIAAVPALGCGSSEPLPGNPPPPPPPPPRDNPPLDVATSQPSATAAAPPTVTPPPKQGNGPFTKLRNPRHPKHGVVYRANAGCIVRIDDGKTRPPGMYPPPTDVPCPPEMQSEVWKECMGDVVMSNDAGTACQCFLTGNPPPPPHPLSRCP